MDAEDELLLLEVVATDVDPEADDEADDADDDGVDEDDEEALALDDATLVTVPSEVDEPLAVLGVAVVAVGVAVVAVGVSVGVVFVVVSVLVVVALLPVDIAPVPLAPPLPPAPVAAPPVAAAPFAPASCAAATETSSVSTRSHTIRWRLVRMGGRRLMSRKMRFDRVQTQRRWARLCTYRASPKILYERLYATAMGRVQLGASVKTEGAHLHPTTTHSCPLIPRVPLFMRCPTCGFVGWSERQPIWAWSESLQ